MGFGDWVSSGFKLEAGEQTTWRWRSFSVLWLYQGSSLSGDHCQAYFRTVLMTALLIRMHRYTIRKAFIDLRGVKIRKRKQETLKQTTANPNRAAETVEMLIILFHSRALL